MLPSRKSVKPAFQLVAQEHAVVVYEGILLQLWRTETTVGGVTLMRKTLKDYASQIDLTFVILEDGAVRPSKEARAALDLLGTELAPRFAAVIYEGEGFGSAAVRAVMTGIGVFTRQALRSKVFSSTEDAVAWARAAYPEVTGVQTVQEFLAEFRRPLEAERRLRASTPSAAAASRSRT